MFDVETTTDPTQRLLIGCYGYNRRRSDGSWPCYEEGIFYADDLPEIDPEGFAVLQDYVRTHNAKVVEGVDNTLHLYSRREFADRVLRRAAFNAGAIVVGFNLPFDVSRIALHVGDSRGPRHRGGFSFLLFKYLHSRSGSYLTDLFRRVRIKHVDSKRSFMQFSRHRKRKRKKGRKRKPERRVPHTTLQPGPLLDLHTLDFALTDKARSLEDATVAWDVPHPKKETEQHGVITPGYVDYNRSDVRATTELLDHLCQELERHPIELDPWKAYSPASIVKAYVRAMGLMPPQERLTT